MAKRREGRQIVMQLLYIVDVFKMSPKEAWRSFFEKYGREKDIATIKDFIEDLLFGTLDNLAVIDKELQNFMTNWDLDRVASVDRAILRMATFEIIFKDDVPIKVVINEAVDIAKDFSTEESGRFVNGIIDKLKLKRGMYERAKLV